jgi:protease II
MAKTVSLQDALFAEKTGCIKEDDSPVPAPGRPWADCTGFVIGGQ